MKNYQNKIFNRGFFFTNKNINNNEYINQNLHGWTLHRIGDATLGISNNTGLAISLNKSVEIYLIGFVIDPFNIEFNSDEIAHKLNTELCHSEVSFLEYLDNLSGRFAIVTNVNGDMKVYGDACSTKTIFYSFKETLFSIASHAMLAAKVFSLEESQDSFDILTSKEFTGRKFLPGLMSPYVNLKPLTPNTYLNINTKSVYRFFPRQEIVFESDVDLVAKKAADILKNQAKILSNFPNVRVSLTAGLDSRITLGSFSGIGMDNVEFFTHASSVNMDAYAEDANIAKRLCDLKGYKHTLIEYAAESTPEVKAFKEVWHSNVGMNRGSLHLFKKYTDHFPENTIHIRSNIAEIARSFFRSTGEPITEKRLASMFSKSEIRNNHVVLSSFKDFIETAKFKQEYFFNYSYEDLFYWEHRMAMWHSWIVNEGDSAFETFVPFNNRKLLNLFLSTERQVRNSDELFIKILENLDIELTRLPVNKKMIFSAI